MNLLYVEDNPLDADLTRRDLAKNAPEVVLDVAAGFRQAMARLQGEPRYDLLLTDLRLPDGDGMALLAHVRQRGLPMAVVIVTGHGDEETVVAALKAGADDYIVKRPDYLGRLPKVLREALRRFHAQRPPGLLRVLYAEPNAGDIDLTRRHLASHAPHILLDVVSTGQQALSRLPESPSATQEAAYDLLLLDYRLPDMDGLELLKEVRQVRECDMPVVLISGRGDQEVALQAFKLGAADYLPKHRDYLHRLPLVLDNAFHRTQLSREQAALRQSEAKFRDLYENAPCAYFSIGVDGRIIRCNKLAGELLGWAVEDLVGRPVLDLYADTPCGKEKAASILERFRYGEAVQDEELRMQKADGTPVWISLSVSIVRDARGEVMASRSMVVDTSMRKQAEEEYQRLQAQLQQAHKMEALGTMAGGIAHDFNNILSAIIGFAELAVSDIEDKKAVLDDLREVLTAGGRAKDLVKRILTFSRPSEQEFRPVQVKPIAQEALKLLRSSLPTTIEISDHIQSDALVMADPTMIHQVLINLCANAGWAMEKKGGVLEVELADVTLDSRFASTHPGVEPGRFIKLTVSDTGRGIAPDIMNRIFDPFFTTKPKGQGTGMGLSLVHGIVNNLKGTITVDSELGKGSVFTVYLPAIERTDEEEEKVFEEQLPTGTERILFVEDEPPIRELSKKSSSP